MSRLMTSAALGLAFGLAAFSIQPALAQAPAGASKDPTAAPAGTYTVDKNHQSVVARVAHGGGYSYSTVRFGVTDATLTWDPAHVENSKVSVTVSTQPNFAPINYRLAPDAPQLLNVAMFPTATFVSTGVKRTGPTAGQIMGNLTLMGQTKPVVIEGQLVGAGKNAKGMGIVGFSGVMKIKRSDFGFTAMAGGIGNDIELDLDAEFDGPAPAAG